MSRGKGAAVRGWQWCEQDKGPKVGRRSPTALKLTLHLSPGAKSEIKQNNLQGCGYVVQKQN